jgi:hypothetical protein
MAGGRLRHRQLGRGTGQAAVGHHAVEHPQQVQVEGAEVDVQSCTI